MEADPDTDLQLDLALELSLPASDPPAVYVARSTSPDRDTPEGEYE